MIYLNHGATFISDDLVFCIFPVPAIVMPVSAFVLNFPCPCLDSTFVMPLLAIVHIAKVRTVGWRGLASATNHRRTTIRIVWKM